jgi:hypothetical protein
MSTHHKAPLYLCTRPDWLGGGGDPGKGGREEQSSLNLEWPIAISPFRPHLLEYYSSSGEEATQSLNGLSTHSFDE